jgi:hypothetical protein
MKVWVKGAMRRVKMFVGSLAIGTMAIGVIATPQQGNAQTQVNYSPVPYVVGNDRGGLLREKLRQLGQLRQQSRPVEIRGAVCYSTCTMYLGLPQTCISPNTTFGFHGPSSYGRSLDAATFNRASTLISSYYPPALRQWYMSKGRYKINSVYKIKGSQIIQMGIRSF